MKQQKFKKEKCPRCLQVYNARIIDFVFGIAITEQHDCQDQKEYNKQLKKKKPILRNI